MSFIAVIAYYKEDIIMTGWLIFAGIVAIAVLANRLWHRCVTCNSFKTFNWLDVTWDTHRHCNVKNRNQFCFRCNKLTLRDDFGTGAMRGTLRRKIAVWYHDKHIKEGEPTGLYG